MDYKVMKRPMFKMGGPTSGGTGITSGLETPRQNFKYGTYGEAVQAIPAMFEKTMTGLENKRSAIGPMALLQAAASGAFTDVDSIGSLAMAAGNPQFLGAGFQGLEQSQKLDTQIDALGLKEATTMATLLKPKGTGDNQAVYDKKVARLGTLQTLISKLDNELPNLEAGTPEYIENRKQKNLATTEIKTTISTSFQTQQDKIDYLNKIYFSENGELPSPKKMQKMLKKLNEIYGLNMAEGGRINKAMGGGMDMGQEQPMQAAQTMAPGPEMMPQGGGQDMGEDPFTILRQRLPQEISDEVVSLIAYNKIAFQDFANIQDQDDVDLFNQKYNVQLVVDMASR
jgi:hypothetical protein